MSTRAEQHGFSGAWWRTLGRLGLTEERWDGLPFWQQRLVKMVVAGLIGVLVFAPAHDLSTTSVYLIVLVLGVLYVPDWGRYRYGRFVLPGAVLLICVLYPYFVENLPGVRFFTAFPDVFTATTMGIYVMMALGLNIVVGYAGLLDLGYVAFYAIGAYTAAWLASPQAARYGWNVIVGGVGVQPGVGGIHISIWLILAVAACLTAIAGVIIGLPTLRLRGDYLAIVTLGFGEIIAVAALQGDNIAGANITNGAQGINPIDPPGFGTWLHDHLGLPADFLNAANSTDLFYWGAIFLVCLIVVCSLMLRDSKLGRAWIAIREDETAAAAMGVPLMRTKTWAYAMGAFFGGIAGAYLKSRDGGAFATDFDFTFSIFVLVMVVLGGMGSIWGVILGGAFLSYLNVAGIANVGGWINTTFGGNRDLTIYSPGIYGIILVVVMLFRPTGLIPSARAKAEFELGVEETPLMDVRGAPEGG